jgi:hypothetical protein
MTTTLKNFVTVRKTRGDVMSPAEYRTIVESIRAIVKKYNFAGLSRDYRALLAHLINFDNPHQDDLINFLEEIIVKTYAIYINMTPTPLTIAEFREQIVPNMSFIELIRRIVMNRYLYDQVKTENGNVPSGANVYVSDDWQTGITAGTMFVGFGNNVIDEVAFLRLGWNANTTPIPLIFNAIDLYIPSNDLPIVYDTTSDTRDLTDQQITANAPVELFVGSNNLTVQFHVLNAPPSAKTVFTLRNSVDTISVRIDTNKSISVIQNGIPLITTQPDLSDGKVSLLISADQKMALRIERLGKLTVLSREFTFNRHVPFTTIAIGVGYESLIAGSFGLRSLAVLHGLSHEILT